MRCYSPEPQSNYQIKIGSEYTYEPVEQGREVAWNLVWLSIPKVDELLNPQVKVREFFDGIDSKAVGELCAMTYMLSPAGYSVQAFMGQSAIAFVNDFQDAFDLPAAPAWSRLGGQTWIDTMMRRAYLADGMSSIYEAAQESTNVILADFTAKRRMS